MMRKKIRLLMAGILLAGILNTGLASTPGRGGCMGFIAGCCFGIRAGAAYNDGKEIHWREWVMLLPYINIVFAIWNGVDGANGMTTVDYQQKYGTAFY